MVFAEIIASVGMFVIALLVCVYLIRYSNQQLTSCLSALEEKHNELVNLNGKLAKQIFSSDKKLRDELEIVKKHSKKQAA